MANSLRKNSFIFLARQIFLFLLAFLVNLYTTRQLRAEDFGYIVVFTAVLSAFSILSDGGIWVGFIQGKKGIDETAFGAMLGFALASSLLLCGALFVATRCFAIEVLRQYHALYYLIGIVAASTVQSVFYAKMERNFEISKIAVCDVLANVVYALSVFALLGRGMGVEGVLASTLARSLVTLASSALLSRERIVFKLAAFDPDFWHEVKRGLVNQASFVVNYLRSLTNPVIIKGLFDSGTVGLVDRAVMFAGIPSSIIVAVSQKVLFPYFSSELRESKSILAKIRESVFVASLGDKLFYVPLVVLFEPFARKYLGAEWVGAVPMVYILVVGNMLWGGLSGVLSACLSGMGKFKLISGLNLATTLLSWIFSVALTRLFGVTGFLLVSPILWLLTIYSYIVVRRELGAFSVLYEVVYPSVLAGVTLAIVLAIKPHIVIENLLLEMCAFTAISYALYGLFILATERRYIPAIIGRLRRGRH